MHIWSMDLRGKWISQPQKTPGVLVWRSALTATRYRYYSHIFLVILCTLVTGLRCPITTAACFDTAAWLYIDLGSSSYLCTFSIDWEVEQTKLGALTLRLSPSRLNCELGTRYHSGYQISRWRSHNFPNLICLVSILFSFFVTQHDSLARDKNNCRSVGIDPPDWGSDFDSKTALHC